MREKSTNILNKINKIIMIKNIWILVGLVVIIVIFLFTKTKGVQQESVADQVLSRGSIRLGYVVYPPMLIKDPNTGKLSGISYDIVEQAAKNLGLRTEWTEEVGWGSMIEGLRTNRYDMIGTAIWPNASRAREATFSVPIMYSVVYPYARSDDFRFDRDLSKANKSNITLATTDGEMSSFIAKSDFPDAKTYALPQLSSVSELLVGLVGGKADLTFVEPAIANDFLKSHPGAIKRVGEVPVRTFGNVFAVKRGEHELVSMWNTAITELIADGTVKRAVEHYHAQDSFFPTQSFVGVQW